MSCCPARTGERRYCILRNARTGETTRLAERVLPLGHGSNFRDLGGYQAAGGRNGRWGMIFRSGGKPLLNPVAAMFAGYQKVPNQ